uniref:Uncharacterized protein n=1 Tax=Mycena chlorophos TaxID=658473 RepID=A0ABQ0M7M9_MYCCL|nr:predicted protein [Mycena chlorophos]
MVRTSSRWIQCPDYERLVALGWVELDDVCGGLGQERRRHIVNACSRRVHLARQLKLNRKPPHPTRSLVCPVVAGP